jgi:hypothetical protein
MAISVLFVVPIWRHRFVVILIDVEERRPCLPFFFPVGQVRGR